MRKVAVFACVVLSVLWLGVAYGQFGGGETPGVPGGCGPEMPGTPNGPQVPGGCGPGVPGGAPVVPVSCAVPDAPDGAVDLSKCSNAFYVVVIF